jgi:serine/threonine protein kinase
MPEAAERFSSEAALPLPRVLGRRILVRLIARGGMGDVYLGATTGIEGAERACIVKTVRRDHVHDGSFLARFLDEARVQAQLQHPGVAQILEAATDDNGEPYTIVEYVEGRSLSDARHRAVQLGLKIAWTDALAVALEIAQALAHVHERPEPDGSPLGIVHRDLSPQNVMVSYSGEVKLIDFGTARGHNRRCHTVAGVVFAKPGYIAPEVARQQVGDGRIDLYALGIMLWEMCAMRRFLSTDPQRHLDDAAAGKVVVPPIARAAGAPAELDDVIAMLTKNDPDERYARASLVVPELARLLASAPDGEPGERGVRPRLTSLMKKLWPHEPGRTRNEFARLLREARATLADAGATDTTPATGLLSESLAQRMTPSDPLHLAGTPYRLTRKIGEGASGVVWEAEHVELGRRVAIKVLAQQHARSPNAFARFRSEARSVAKLSHPNLVQTLDFGKSLDGRAYLAMELCAGETLDVVIASGPLEWRDAVRVAIEAAKALAAAHEAGLVHRDLKPENLVVTQAPFGADGRRAISEVKLLDFGVAMAMTGNGNSRPATAKERALQGFALFGTPEYMAPEQISGETVDGRTDLYALGCVIYEMLTGEAAFEGPSSVVVMGKQLRETPTAPRERAPTRNIPPELQAIVTRAMAKRPADRFPSAKAMGDALEATLALPERRRAQKKQLASAVFTALCVVAAAVGSARWSKMQSTPTTMSGESPFATETAPILLPIPSYTAPTAASVEPATPLATAAASSPSLREARTAAKVRSGDPKVLEAWAHAALRSGDLRDARRATMALGEWLESHPDAADVRAELARLSGENGARELARR